MIVPGRGSPVRRSEQVDHCYEEPETSCVVRVPARGLPCIVPVMRRNPGSPATSEIRAAARHDVIAARTLVAIGVPESTVYERCRDGGPWQRLLPGIVLLNTGTPTPEQLVAAALLHAGPESMISGLEACRRHGVRRGPTPGRSLQLLVPHTRQVRNNSFVLVERSTRLPRPVVRGGVPLAPVARAVVDAARRLRSEREITELISDAVQRGLCTVAQLAAELAMCAPRGSATPRRVLRGVSAGARSAAERDAQKLWRRSGLPEPWWNAAVHDSGGRLLGIADAWWDDVALAWEINSYAWHLSPADYARETAKDARFTAAGVAVLPTLPTRLTRDGNAVLAELRGAHTHAASRPRPAVRAARPQQGGFTPTGPQ